MALADSTSKGKGNNMNETEILNQIRTLASQLYYGRYICEAVDCIENGHYAESDRQEFEAMQCEEEDGRSDALAPIEVNPMLNGYWGKGEY